MKLLFDQNISYRIIQLLNAIFPESKHITDVGLNNASDNEIWEFSKNSGYTIVTFDADFYDLALIKGIPPKIIWLRLGNTSTLNISYTLTENERLIKEFCDLQNNNSCLEISNFYIKPH